MDIRDDLKSILPFLPLKLQSSSLLWPSQVVESLKALSRGPDHSRVDSGEILFVAISNLRNSLSLSEPLAFSAAQGYSIFFDELMTRVESMKWFGEVVPALATLLLRLPSLLEAHYQAADVLLDGGEKGWLGGKTGLRLLNPQEAGIVFLSQELIGALLACSFFCLFPTIHRGANHLPDINLDQLFASLSTNFEQNEEHKVKCLTHYFGRICSCMSSGFVSFERKVLPLRHSPHCVSYPEAEFWSKSGVSLCHFEVFQSGLIEDHPSEALEVDFADEYIGGLVLRRGCVQEEIRFVINPELIVGMLFLPCMADNEAIEIVGAERFSNYAGYDSSFHFSGDFLDTKPVDLMGRRKTRIIAIDALCNPRMKQYRLDRLLRETNKAFCGFIDQEKYQEYHKIVQGNALYRDEFGQEAKGFKSEPGNGASGVVIGDAQDEQMSLHDDIGVATGNWGCGVFGGDPELKSTIQWLAASQALRPSVSYYTFGEKKLRSLDQVIEWVRSNEWTVGDLWNMVVEYSSKRLKEETHVGFFNWILPSLSKHGGAVIPELQSSSG